MVNVIPVAKIELGTFVVEFVFDKAIVIGMRQPHTKRRQTATLAYIRSPVAAEERPPTGSPPASKELLLNVVEPVLQLGQQCRRSLATHVLDVLRDAPAEAGMALVAVPEGGTKRG